MKSKDKCTHCGCHYKPNPRIKNQNYCGKPECQRARKAKWQREKIKSDPDYRLNQEESQQSWQERHPGYWKEYRQKHQEYTDRNRKFQKNRDFKRRIIRLAKMDTLQDEKILKSISYYLIPMPSDLAKMDASIQKIILIPDGYINDPSSCKKGHNGHVQEHEVI